MTADASENSNLADRRGVEREASAQLTTLTSLLAGFGFGWFTTLAGNETPTLFSLAILVVTALAILVLVLASILGALLTVASGLAIREGPLRRAEILWVAATKWGILLFSCERGFAALPGEFCGRADLFDIGGCDGGRGIFGMGLDSTGVFAARAPARWK
jgi:hypothetical protein